MDIIKLFLYRLPRFDPSNGYEVVLFADFRRIKYPSRRSIFLHSNDMAEPVQDINAVHNVYIFEEFIQLTIESNADIIDNSHWAEELT